MTAPRALTLGGGYGLRLFVGFAGLVLVMLAVSAVVFISLFGGYRDDLDRSELRTAGNALSVEIARILGRAAIYDRVELITLIRDQAEHAGLIVILADSQGRVIPGFEPHSDVRTIGLTHQDITNKAKDSGWLDTKIAIEGEWRPALARILVRAPRARDGQESILMAVTFGEALRTGLLGELIVRLVVSGLAGLAAAVVLAMLLSRQLMRPLEALTGVVRQFGADRYDLRAVESGPTQVRDLAVAFNAMAERVDANERAMRGFIADVSHELRTPLTSIRGFVEAMRDGTVSEPERRASSLDVVHDETQRMLRMIEQLLDLSRLEAGQGRLQRSSVEIDELFAHVEALFGDRAETEGIELRSEIEPGATSVEADFDRLVQVLSNLLDNALRHTQAGSVEIRSRSVDDGLELSVSDTGVGIAEDDLERLFDRFWQPESRSGPGAGLGLAISREIVRAHGGRVGAQSELGSGTTIAVWLPGMRGKRGE